MCQDLNQKGAGKSPSRQCQDGRLPCTRCAGLWPPHLGKGEPVSRFHIGLGKFFLGGDCGAQRGFTWLGGFQAYAERPCLAEWPVMSCCSSGQGLPAAAGFAVLTGAETGLAIGDFCQSELLLPSQPVPQRRQRQCSSTWSEASPLLPSAAIPLRLEQAGGGADCPPNQPMNLSCYACRNSVGFLGFPAPLCSSWENTWVQSKVNAASFVSAFNTFLHACAHLNTHLGRDLLFQCIYMATKCTRAPFVTKCSSRMSQLKLEWFVIGNSDLLYYKPLPTLIWPEELCYKVVLSPGANLGSSEGTRVEFWSIFSQAEDLGWLNVNESKFLCVACVLSILISLSSSCIPEHLQELQWHLLRSLFSEWAAPPV